MRYQDNSSEHKSSKADGCFPSSNVLLFCHRAPGRQENRRYHQGMKASISGFLPRPLKDLGSTVPFLLVLSRFQIQHNTGLEQNSFGVRSG